jgi:hypothetical protein
MYRRAVIAAVLCIAGVALAQAQAPATDRALQHSEAQLAGSVGVWDVTTDFLNPDGTVAKSVKGTYEFTWVVPRLVVSGRSEIPELRQASGILFYINAKKRQIEMASVGGDGQLWIMTGKLGEEVRTTQEFKTSGGGVGRLRFTRFNVVADSFESKMEYTEDGGKTWRPGNHQYFRRAPLTRK